MHKKNFTNSSSNNLSTWLALLILGAGIACFTYPKISNYYSARQQAKLIHTYRAKVSASSKKALQKELQATRDYNNQVSGHVVHEPFIQGSGYVMPANYEQLLNINGDDIIGYISIPKINVSLPIYHGASDDVFQKGAGHIPSTALPIGGKGNNSVICAHRGMPSAAMFTDLDKLKKGDYFFIHVLNKKLTYRVDKIFVVKPDEVKHIQPVKTKDLVTLLTCTPYGINTKRLLVQGVRSHAPTKSATPKQHNFKLVYLFYTIPLIFIFLLLKKIRYHHKANK